MVIQNMLILCGVLIARVSSRGRVHRVDRVLDGRASLMYRPPDLQVAPSEQKEKSRS